MRAIYWEITQECVGLLNKNWEEELLCFVILIAILHQSFINGISASYHSLVYLVLIDN